MYFDCFLSALNALSKKKTNFKAGKAEAKGRDADDEGKKKGTSRAMKMMYQMDGEWNFATGALELNSIGNILRVLEGFGCVI